MPVYSNFQSTPTANGAKKVDGDNGSPRV